MNNRQSFLYTRRFVFVLLFLCVGILAIAIGNLSKPHGLLLRKDASYVFSVSWSPDGSKLASAKDSGEIDIWDTRSWNVIDTLIGHKGYVVSVKWNSNGNKLASVGLGEVAHIWDTKTKQILSTFVVDDYASNNINWSINDSRIMTTNFMGQGLIQVWDMSTDALLSTFTSRIGRLDVNPNMTKLAFVDADGIVKIRDISNPGQIETWVPGNLTDVPSRKWFLIAWSADGNKIAGEDAQHNIRIWNAVTGELIGNLPGHTANITNLRWSKDSTKLASSSDDNTVRIWNVDNLKLINQIDISKRQYISGKTYGDDGLLWDHHGDKLAALGGNIVDQHNHIPGEPNIVLIWNVVTGELTTLDHDRSVGSMSWSPDDGKLATSGGYGIMIWPIPNNSHSK